MLLLGALAACGSDDEFRQNLGVLAVTPIGPIVVDVAVEGGGLDEPTDTTVVVTNEGPGSVDILTTRIVHVAGEQDWSLIQGYESSLPRGSEAELVVRYSPEFESDATANLIIVVEGSFANEAWEEDTAEIVLEGTAVDAD